MIDDRTTAQINASRLWSDMQAKAAKATDEARLSRLAKLTQDAAMQALSAEPAAGLFSFRTSSTVAATSGGIKIP